MGNAHLTRRTLLGGATAVALGATTAGVAHATTAKPHSTGAPLTAPRTAPSATPQVPPIWREFNRTPYTHPQ
ncbi:hypothetical protein DMH26_44365, partial [Streptomyces sp. WAC 05379]